MPRLTDGAIDDLSRRHLKKLMELCQTPKQRLVDKMPDNYSYLPFMMKMFRNAKFFHCMRDPRDVAVSCWMTDFRSIRWANRFTDIASRINTYQHLMERWRKMYGEAIIDISYEDTVHNFEATARRIIDACELTWDIACLEFYRTSRRVRTASVTQVRQPIYKNSLSRWKNYERELSELFA